MNYYVRSSSSDEVYEVSAKAIGANVWMRCTCQAGQIGSHCKHRINLIWGDISSLIEERSADPKKLIELLTGSDLMRAAEDLVSLEMQADALKREIAKQKKKLSRLLLGPAS